MHAEDGAPVAITGVFGTDASAMSLGDRPHDDESHAEAPFFRREEGLEQVLSHRGR